MAVGADGHEEPVPFPDVQRRARVRRAARGLVTCKVFHQKDATGEQLAQLAGLRLVWLQTQTRRSVRLRQKEAAGMLVRECLDTCMAGLCQWPSKTPHWWPDKRPTPKRAAQAFVSGPPPLLRASRMRNDGPSVTTTMPWWTSRSSRDTAVVSLGRKRPQSSKGQWLPMASARRS